MFRSGTCRVCGHAAVFAWSDVLGREPQACWPAVTRNSDPNFRELRHLLTSRTQSPVTRRGVRRSRPLVAGEPAMSGVLFLDWGTRVRFARSVARFPQRGGDKFLLISGSTQEHSNSTYRTHSSRRQAASSSRPSQRGEYIRFSGCLLVLIVVLHLGVLDLLLRRRLDLRREGRRHVHVLPLRLRTQPA